jgi:parallel beta-helix repeat protein
MTDDRSKALIPEGPTSLSPVSRLAERTLTERVERALVAARMLVVGPGGFPTITAAVTAARDGDTILVRPGRYKESVIVEGKTITIRGDGDRDTIVVGWDKGPAFMLVETRSTLTGLTIVGGNPDPASDGFASLGVAGGAPELDRLLVRNGVGVVFAGGAAGDIEHSEIRRNRCGILAYGGAFPRIEGNEIWANLAFGMSIVGAGTDPLVRANRVHDGKGPGILVSEGASPRIERNEIRAHADVGIAILDLGTDPLVRTNRVHDGKGSGILVSGGASPTIKGNTVTGNARGAIVVNWDSDPAIGRNVVRD